jgi:Na+/H+ antiporter NhaD/arsenite permease-like protein
MRIIIGDCVSLHLFETLSNHVSPRVLKLFSMFFYCSLLLVEQWEERKPFPTDEPINSMPAGNFFFLFFLLLFNVSTTIFDLDLSASLHSQPSQPTPLVNGN